MRPIILVVQNAEWEGPGLIGLHARAAGVGLATVELFRKSALAPTMPFADLEKGAFSAVVGLGSPSTAYLPKSNPHHDELVRLFKLTRRRGIPSFNICYSMQLFSLAHGGRVARNPAGKEVGFGEVRPTPEGRSDKVIGPIGPYTTLRWHGDIVEELPRGAVCLASSKKTEEPGRGPGRDTLPGSGGRAGGHPLDGQELAEARRQVGDTGYGHQEGRARQRGSGARGVLPKHLPQDLRELPRPCPLARRLRPDFAGLDLPIGQSHEENVTSFGTQSARNLEKRL